MSPITLVPIVLFIHLGPLSSRTNQTASQLLLSDENVYLAVILGIYAGARQNVCNEPNLLVILNASEGSQIQPEILHFVQNANALKSLPKNTSSLTGARDERSY